MSSGTRKSILNVQNIELNLPEQTQHFLQVPNTDQLDCKYSFTPSPKCSFRPSLFQKMQRLNVLKVSSTNGSSSRCLTSFKSKAKPNICISELWGAKEKYLRKTSFLEAYKELKKVHEIDSSIKSKNSRKIEKPHVEDYQVKVKVMMNTNSTPNSSQKKLATIYEKKDKKANDAVSEKIDFIIQKCSEIGKGKLSKTGVKLEINDLSESNKKNIVAGKKLSKIYSSSKLTVNTRRN